MLSSQPLLWLLLHYSYMWMYLKTPMHWLAWWNFRAPQPLKSLLPTHPLPFFFFLLFFSLPPVVLSQTPQWCGANWPIFRLEVRGLISCQWVHMALCPAKLWPGPSLIHTRIPRAAPPWLNSCLPPNPGGRGLSWSGRSCCTGRYWASSGGSLLDIQRLVSQEGQIRATYSWSGHRQKSVFVTHHLMLSPNVYKRNGAENGVEWTREVEWSWKAEIAIVGEACKATF